VNNSSIYSLQLDVDETRDGMENAVFQRVGANEDKCGMVNDAFQNVSILVVE
jgi:hypothetical protein